MCAALPAAPRLVWTRGRVSPAFSQLHRELFDYNLEIRSLILLGGGTMWFRLRVTGFTILKGLTQRLDLLFIKHKTPNLHCKTADLTVSVFCWSSFIAQRFQSEEHLLIHRHKHEMTLKFSSIKTDAAFTGETTKAVSPGSALDKKKNYLSS